MITFVSLFRGINVGGHHTVRMDELKELYASLGFRDVVTYIQSGNVVAISDDVDMLQLMRDIEDGFAQKFGFHAKVMLRTAAELQEIIANNPFQNQPTKESNGVVVMFLASSPDSLVQEELLKTHAGPEELYISNQEVYIYYPNGIGRSKLTNTLLEKKLKAAGTGRNWNTILQLQKLIHR